MGNKVLIRAILRTFLLCFVFLLCQVLAQGAVLFAARFMEVDSNGYHVAIVSLLGNFLLFLVLSIRRWVSWRLAFAWPSISVPRIVGVVLASSAIILGLNLFSELINLPDNNVEMMKAMLQHPLGMLAIALVGPLAEELLFREAMISGMLRMGQSPSLAVCVSALAFGVIHVNPAQVPFAFIMGLFFGFIYLRSRSIVLTFMLHVLNNGLAVYFLLNFGEDVTLSDLLSPFLPSWCMASLLCVVGMVVVSRLLRN